MTGHASIRIPLNKAGGPGCIPEAGVALQDARSEGRHGYPHQWRPSLWNGLPGKVGKDQAPDKGVVKNTGTGLPPPTLPAGEYGFSHLHGLHLSMAKPLHQRASLDDRFMEARQGEIRRQDEGEGARMSASRLGKGPGCAVLTGG